MESRAPLALAVVIVNYRTPDLVVDCLESLVPQLPSRAGVVVVDNASGDHSIETLQAWIDGTDAATAEKVHLLASPANGGFSAGNNLGIKRLRAKFYLLLNSDTIVRPGAISLLMDRIQRDTKIAAVGPRLEYLDGRPQVSRFRRRGVTSEFIRGAQIQLISHILRRKNTPIELDEPEQQIDWVSFACVLLRAEVIKKIGLMDEQFFMYFEDIEYCLRIQKAGYTIEQALGARVVHLRGGTSSVKESAKNKKRIPAYFYRSRTRYFMLLGGKKRLLIANLAWYFGRAIRMLKCLRGKYPGPRIPGEWHDIWIDFLAPQTSTTFSPRKSSRVVDQ
ncbi:glycosyltransferase family 2 protein [Microbulbifer agarilyticus]|uniref:glycosyltransferase family 2 protein n=1 Tax=Microbulbifer agarilyticus TaxID=260552 RepID=UPI001C94316A|nr:glycosyltransferase family 2 protein [Microbulbifer agarilyticus]MBY6190742.1 glycosyltransferase family 2 protein [Microbulbifer agarilyticus]